MRTRLQSQIFSYFIAIILLSLIAASLYTSNSLRNFHVKQLLIELEGDACIIEKLVDGRYRKTDSLKLAPIIDELGLKLRKRITVLGPKGEVIADSSGNFEEMGNHADRPEIREALAGRVGSIRRLSQTIGESFVYVAVPSIFEERVQGIIRVSSTVVSIGDTLEKAYYQIALGGLIIAMLAAVFSFFMSYRMNARIMAIRMASEKFASGQLDYRIPPMQLEEMGELADSMNAMAAQLDQRIQTITRQRNELEALLSGMVEAVFVVDTDHRFVMANHAFGEMFEIHPDQVIGTKISEVAPNPELENFVEITLASESPTEGDVIILKDGERNIQAHGRSLRDHTDRRIGALVVLNDITRLKRLERVRRDFVANVSHELKTPITSIIGFAETLNDGAIDNPTEAKKFLEIIASHADRLAHIIEDLLTLSRIEQESPESEVSMNDSSIKDVVESAVLMCQKTATAKSISIDIRCKNDISARINPALLEQATVNLVENAVKYSDEGSEVSVEYGIDDENSFIRVIDNGIGIPKQHLPRIFERFYRVDKARSRKLGGTGLGLSIVKNIAKAHKGGVSVESEVGKGSCFTIRIPRD